MNEFLVAYAFTLAIETTVILLLLRNRYPAPLIARNSIIASSLTLPFVWFVFPLSGLAWPVQTAISEIFAFLAEAGFYRLSFKGMGWKGALAASFACNAASFLSGLAVL